MASKSQDSQNPDTRFTQFHFQNPFSRRRSYGGEQEEEERSASLLDLQTTSSRTTTTTTIAPEIQSQEP
ncbi:hypothetical protein Hanom_Chr17g01559651 [Helianthus anomalus]